MLLGTTTYFINQPGVHDGGATAPYLRRNFRLV